MTVKPPAGSLSRLRNRAGAMMRTTMTKMLELESMNESELLELYSELMEELRRREVLRTSNNPVADYAEKVAVNVMKLHRAGKEERGYDALDTKGNKYQIKGRRITRHNNSRQLGVIRNLDEKLFDFLIAVIFKEKFQVLEIWKIPYKFVKENSKWSEHQNGNIFHAKPEVLKYGEGVERLV